MSTVFRLSQVTYDWDDPDPRNLIFTEQLFGYSIRSQMSGSCTTDASGNGSIVITHSFGYAPWVEGFVTTKEGYYINAADSWYGNSSSRGAGDYLQELFQITVTTTTVTLSVNATYVQPGGGGTVTPVVGQNYTFNVLLHMERIDA